MVKLDIDNLWAAETKEKAPDESNTRWLRKVCIDGVITDIDADCFSAESIFGYHNLCVDQWFTTRGDEPYVWGEVYNALVRNTEAILTHRMQLPTAEHLLRQVKCLASRNHYPPFSRFCITVFCQDNNTLSVRWVLRQERLKAHPFALDDNKIILQNCETPIIIPSVLSKASIMSADAKWTNEKAIREGYSGACLRNTQGMIATTTLGSLYLINGRTVVTPPFKCGAPRDVLRPYVIRALNEEGFQCHESEEITTETMKVAAECFVSDIRYGIRPITGFANNRYLTDRAKQVAERLKSYFF